MMSFSGAGETAENSFTVIVLKYLQEMRHTRDGSLEITTPQMNHAGRYTCHVSNLAGDDHITYLLKVQEPPRIISDIPGSWPFQQQNVAIILMNRGLNLFKIQIAEQVQAMPV